MKFRLSHVPLRLATGAFILNSGITKWKEGDDDTYKGVHGMAAGAYPQLEEIEPETFTRLLAAGEIALGTALLAPFINPALAGVGLTAFSGGLVGLYLRSPGMRQHDSIRPSQQGTAIAKDSWLLAIGLSLMLDAFARRFKRKR